MQYMKSLVRSFIESLWTLFLSIVVPQYLKKVIFVASVYIVLFELSSDDKQTFQRINDKLKLVNKPDLLIIPQSLVDSIWESQEVKTLLQEAELVKLNKLNPCLPSEGIIAEAVNDEYKSAMHLANKLVEKAPLWLRYGKIEDQISDILVPTHDKLFSHA